MIHPQLIKSLFEDSYNLVELSIAGLSHSDSVVQPPRLKK